VRNLGNEMDSSSSSSSFLGNETSREWKRAYRIGLGFVVVVG